MTDRRGFITKSISAAGALVLNSSFISLPKEKLTELNTEALKKTPEALASDEDFWSQMKQAYTVSPNIINLNNGGVSPAPKVVQESLARQNAYANEAPSYYMWRIMSQGKEPLRENLAKYAGVSPEEIAINRNATEALNTIIMGMTLKAGDEVILSKYDYPNMLHAWRQREQREGIVLKYVDLKLPSESKNELVKIYADQMTAKTKVVHVTHMINWNGQIMPVKEIADLAHKKNIEVVCDGAHTFAHIDHKISDLNCDYYGTSLHKWLCAPIGSGMLWIKKEHISKIYPLIPNDTPLSDDIRKFENLGTRSFPIEQAIGEALNFQYSIGNERKEARLRYLKNYWAEEAIKMERIRLNTSLKSNFSCALAHVGIAGLEAGEMESKLFGKYKVHTSPTKWEALNGIRIAPHIYTSTRDLDRLLDGLKYLHTL
jgi:selenocysteine lyase/cysteine desulfurase